MRIDGAKIVVVGLKRSGLAALELLVAKGARPVATDSRPLAEIPEAAEKLAALQIPFVAQSAGAFAGADGVVISPGVPADLAELEEARRLDIPVIGEVELAGFYLQGPVIGITGSNGKTTTTELIGHILRQAGVPCQVGGNIGVPPTAMINSSKPDHWNVLELSSFQLETIRTFHAKIGVATNVTPNHLEVHHTFQNYANAKARLFETQAADAFAVLNANDPTCVSYSRRTRGTTVWFSSTDDVSHGAWLRDGIILFEDMPWMPVAEIPLRGLHNVENVMAAAVAARLAGASLDRIREAVATFPGVEHRIEFVRELDGVKYYNDSKATSVDATQKAIDSFDGNLWIILGGKDKNSDYTTLRPALASKAKVALLIGKAAAKIESQIHGSVDIAQCGDLATAVARARSLAEPGDIVLLAPACASFDQFESFEHRGRVFKQLVHELAPGR